MSTLTHSPSPAASPRSPFHIRSPRPHYAPARHSPRPSPRIFSADSPRRAFNAPGLAAAAAASSPAPQQPKQHYVESGGQAALAFRYVDAGTQYSPEASPPTARRALAGLAATQQQQPPGSAGSAAKKRKEVTRSESPPTQPMSGATSSSGSTSSAPRSVPAEPRLRVPPSPTTAKTQDGASDSLPSRSADAGASSEPQEARSTAGHSSAPKRARPDDSAEMKVMPLRYETCNPKDLGVLISNMLMELIRLNDQIPLRDGRLTRFHSRAPPGISVSDYLQRLIQHATLSPPIMLSMVYYIDRLCALYPAFTINSLTVHRFLITAATVAAKGLSDSFWTNPTYARIGGIPVSELATLELEFLQKVQWKIVPKPEVLEDYYRSLVERTEGFVLEDGGDSSSSSSSSDSSDGDGDEKMLEQPPT